MFSARFRPLEVLGLRPQTPGVAGWVVAVAAGLYLAIAERSWIGGGVVLAGLGGLAWSVVQQGARQARLAAVDRAINAILRGAPPSAPDVIEPRDPLEALEQKTGRLASWVTAQLKELAKKSRNLEALIDALDEPVIATGPEERIVLFNRSAEALFQPGGGTLMNRPVAEVLTSESLLEFHAGARRGETRRGRVRLTTTTLGTRTFQVSASPLPRAWGEGVFGAVLLLRDVTELAQAVQVKSDFVANASHELRTPVAAIQAAAETLQDAVRDDAPMAERLARTIVSHAARLDEMMRDLLDLSRLESPDVKIESAPINALELTAELGGMFEDICARRRLDLRFEIEPELANLRSDRKLLMLILRNLVENATKFAAEGTTIRVVGLIAEHDVPEVLRLPPAGEGDGTVAGVVRFEVIDQGIGIPLAHQERVFERYYQVDQARTGSGIRRGTGLGLSIVKHAVKVLQGRVGLRSVWQQGTTVWFEIPVRFEATPGLQPASRRRRPAADDQARPVA